MKRLIVTCSPKSLEEDECLKHCNILKDVYCKFHNIDFKFLTVPENVEGRHYAWAQIPIIQKYIDSYDQILWLSYDIVLTNPIIDLFEFIKDKSLNPGATISAFEHNETMLPSIILFNCAFKTEITEFLNEWWNDADDEVVKIDNISLIFNKVCNKKKEMCNRIKLNFHSETPTIPFFQVSDSLKMARLAIVKKYFFKLYNKQKSRKRIALVIRDQNFYSNGVGQNCLFIKHTLEGCGYDVDLVTHDNAKVASGIFPYKLNKFGDLNLEDYFLFMLGSQVVTSEEFSMLKKKGVGVVIFNMCNVIDQFHQENFLYVEKKSSTPLFEMNFHKFSDEIWILDGHVESSFEYLQIINQMKIPVIPIPWLWSPHFLFKDGAIPIYQPRTKSAKVDIVILEPNLGYCKSGWLPLIISEKFHLDNPERINKVYLFNTPASNPTAMGMINSLKLCEDKRMKTMARMPINEILSFFANPAKNGGNHVIFISHSINSPLNYAYCDVLYCGFPFIHNSKYLKQSGIGYHYDTLFEGSAHIQRIIDDFHVGDSLTKARDYLQRYDEYQDHNIKAYDSLVKKFMKSPLPTDKGPCLMISEY